jgi:hypothetical protein
MPKWSFRFKVRLSHESKLFFQLLDKTTEQMVGSAVFTFNESLYVPGQSILSKLPLELHENGTLTIVVTNKNIPPPHFAASPLPIIPPPLVQPKAFQCPKCEALFSFGGECIQTRCPSCLNTVTVDHRFLVPSIDWTSQGQYSIADASGITVYNFHIPSAFGYFSFKFFFFWC